MKVMAHRLKGVTLSYRNISLYCTCIWLFLMYNKVLLHCWGRNTENRHLRHILIYHCTVLNHDLSQIYLVEGDEVFWVGLVIVEDHEHGGLLLVVHHTVIAVGGVWASRRGGFQRRRTDFVTAGQDTSNIQPPQACCVCWGISTGWIICVDGEVNSLSIQSSCDRIT